MKHKRNGNVERMLEQQYILTQNFRSIRFCLLFQKFNQIRGNQAQGRYHISNYFSYALIMIYRSGSFVYRKTKAIATSCLPM
jgi:hypothetical protein